MWEITVQRSAVSLTSLSVLHPMVRGIFTSPILPTTGFEGCTEWNRYDRSRQRKRGFRTFRRLSG